MQRTVASERQGRVYERVGQYPQPPLVQIPDTLDISSLECADAIRDSRVATAAAKMFLRTSGVRAFAESLPGRLEELLREHNLRISGLAAPTTSATVGLVDDPEISCPYRRAASLICAGRSLCDDVMSGALPADEEEGRPIEMGQYPNLFGTHVVIEDGQANTFKTVSRNTVAVLCRGNFYELEIGEASVDDIAAALESIGKESESTHESAAIGTCGDLPDQVRVFMELQRDGTNARTLAKLQNTLFTVCLDLDDEPEDDFRAAWFCQSANRHNRWFHASWQIVVFGNAKACTLHSFVSYLDGNVMMRGSAELQGRAARLPRNGASGVPRAERLFWRIPPRAFDAIERATHAWYSEEPATFRLSGLGADFFKSKALPPVPGFVLGLQMAANRLVGKQVRIQQFVSQARYRCMGLRTANISTPQVQALVARLTAGEASIAKELFDGAIESQRTACEAVRSFLRMEDVLLLCWRTQERRNRVQFSASLAAAFALLGVTGRSDLRHDVMISHPRIFAETTFLGRPGARLPYLRHFGLHYQIYKAETIVTMMPGVDWKTPNAEVVAAIENALRAVAQNAP